MAGLRRFLFLLVLFVVRMWLLPALLLKIFPVPVVLNLLAAPRLDFNFGISIPPFYYTFPAASDTLKQPKKAAMSSIDYG
jgi:hypothetical protein